MKIIQESTELFVPNGW